MILKTASDFLLFKLDVSSEDAESPKTTPPKTKTKKADPAQSP